MATVVHMTGGNNESGTGSSFATGSWSPPANALVMLEVTLWGSDNMDTTSVVGNGLTWRKLVGFQGGTTSLSIWVASTLGVTPTTGATTVNMSLTTGAVRAWDIVSITGLPDEVLENNGTKAFVLYPPDPNEMVGVGSSPHTPSGFSNVRDDDLLFYFGTQIGGAPTYSVNSPHQLLYQNLKSTGNPLSQFASVMTGAEYKVRDPIAFSWASGYTRFKGIQVFSSPRIESVLFGGESIGSVFLGDRPVESIFFGSHQVF